jgi:hypothetical protein
MLGCELVTTCDRSLVETDAQRARSEHTGTDAPGAVGKGSEL